jgi:cyanophycin synthetase
VGDRQDSLVESLGEIGGRDADVVAIGHKERYLRGRTTEELDRLLRTGAARVGMKRITSYPTELEALQALIGQAGPGDVVGLMCHAEREQVYEWLSAEGATSDSPEDLRAKVERARGEA